ncbi:VOC family protein [Aromatoleum sp.]|uniref:VOC family protein n=1 Tax=Aromatoleum sp. TaxID=2307007 RepID=UPI002FCA3CA0
MRLNPYLMFDGQCEAAFKFYEQCFGGKLEAMLPYSDSPECGDIPPESRDRIMHACLVIDGQKLMGSDTTPQYPHEGIKGCSVTLNVDSIAEAERLFNALSENGSVMMTLEKTFWAVRFGMCTDRFGVPWMINCEKDQ